MTPRELERALEAIRTGAVRRPTAALRRLLYGAGWTGASVLPPELIGRVRRLLTEEHGVSPDLFDASRPPDRPGTRTETLRLLRDEKAGRVRTRRPVLLRHQPGGALRCAGVETRLPPGGALHLELEGALHLRAEGLILVENWEPFLLFDRLDFPVPQAWRCYPLLFRGAPNLSSQAEVERLIRALDLPVISFPDLDPAGLGAALAAPRVSGLLWPGPDRLRAELAGRLARPDRYLSQVGQYRARLEAAEGAFAEAWGLIREAGAGLMQEAFIGAAVGAFRRPE